MMFFITSLYGSETVYDRSTGLEWSNNGYPYLTVKKAKKYCKTLILAGKEDWYLPTIKELFTLVNFNDKPVIKKAFWSSSPFEYGIYFKDYRKDHYWYVTKEGFIKDWMPSGAKSIICVRRK